ALPDVAGVAIEVPDAVAYRGSRRVLRLRSPCAIAAPVDACAETRFMPGAAMSGRSHTSPDGPRPENGATDCGCVPAPPEQSSSSLLAGGCCQPAQVSPERVSSWLRS